MIRDAISLADVLRSFESTLRISYGTLDVSQIIKSSRRSLENEYRVQIQSSIFDTQTASSRMVAEALDEFLAQLTECLKSLTLLTSITLFDGKVECRLSDVNYLGLAQSQMRAVLQYLQDSTLYEQRTSFVPDLVRYTTNIDISVAKRVLVIMLVMEDLGIKEGVAAIAQYLYLGVA